VNSPDARDSESNAAGVEGRPLDADERDAFLEGGLLARLACLDDRGWPYIVPVWFDWDGDRFWIVGTVGAAWASFVAADFRVSLSIDDPGTLRRVICQGVARIEELPTRNGRWTPVARRMSARYLGERAAAYNEETSGVERCLFSITPTRMITWQGPGKASQASS
jgi:nitroimidazol reductase NimA-like FMN-containing flavoprotein (pyridoxamine 5'-phosphate oxidase superfamily)